MIGLFRAMLTAIFWHKTASHYRRPDHKRLHEARQVMCTAAFGIPGMPLGSNILTASRVCASVCIS